MAVLFVIHFLAGVLLGGCGRVGVLAYVIAFVFLEAVLSGIVHGTVFWPVLLFFGLSVIVEVGYLVGSAVYLYVTDAERPKGAQVNGIRRHLSRSKGRLFSII